MAYKQRRQRRKIIRRPKDCFFCKQRLVPDYKEIDTLNHFVSDRGKIIGRMQSGICQKHQKILVKSIKRARHLSLLPFIVRPS
ncbi:30S ribosomal protein S18 [Candidatus Microgenomates bacterium]|nr:30S ribosomal protein S18 [Candidatus Microgenomates bacterium]